LERQRGLLLIRLDQEEREIKALKHEVHVKHIARFLAICFPVPSDTPTRAHTLTRNDAKMINAAV
jgi:hypothetical protein